MGFTDDLTFIVKILLSHLLNLDPPLHLEQNIEQPCRVSLEPLARQDEHAEMREAVVAEEHPVEIRQVGRIFFCDHLPCGLPSTRRGIRRPDGEARPARY